MRGSSVREWTDPRRYDIIYGDAFNDLSVPYHLTTVEFNQLIAARLKPDGIYLVNVIDKFDGGEFLKAYANSLRQAFPHVYIFGRGPTFQPFDRNTYVVMAGRQPLDQRRRRSATSRSDVFSATMPLDEGGCGHTCRRRALTLTDDFAPVDQLLAALFIERGRYNGFGCCDETDAHLFGSDVRCPVGAAAPAAHHSFAPHFDRDKPVSISGTITDYERRNPHSYLHITATDENGRTREYVCESHGVTQLTRNGVTPALLKPGTKVRVNGSLSRHSPYMCFFDSVELPDGRVLNVNGSNAVTLTAAKPVAHARTSSARGCWRRLLAGYQWPATHDPVADVCRREGGGRL